MYGTKRYVGQVLLFLVFLVTQLGLPTVALAESSRFRKTDAFIQYLRKAVQTAYNVPSHDILIFWDDQDLEVKLAGLGKNLEIEVSEQDLQNIVKRSSLSLKVMDGSQYKGRIPIRVKVDGWVDVYQTRRSLNKDQQLAEEALEAKRVKLSDLPAQYIRAPFRIEEYMTRQDIPAGKLLQPSMLKEKPLVEQEMSVRVIVINQGLRLVAQGEALEAGVRDQQIRVRIMNFGSNSIIKARVTGMGEVTLEIEK